MPKSQLLELYAHGLGVIEDAMLEFGPGFNVITGETGAGKTLLLGALELCLGTDSSTSRQAVTPQTRAAAVFDRDGAEVVLSRESTPSGRLRSSLDGVPSSVEALKSLASELIVIHGQHDSLALRSRTEVLRIIDARGAVSTDGLDGARRTLRDARKLRDTLGGDSASRERESDFIEYQIAELTQAAIKSAGELDDVLEELTRLTELRDGQSALADVVNQLDADEDTAILGQFARAIDRLPTGQAYESPRQLLRGALEQAREGLHELAQLADADAFDPDALATLEDRASVLRQVARKYGGDLESALATLSTLMARQGEQADIATRLTRLDAEIELAEQHERVLAADVLRQRSAAAQELTLAVRAQLPRVALADAALRFTVAGDDGSDAQILFTPNPGLPEGPLQSLASGGELSRVLLALSLETVHEDLVAVFDEVDAGVGGQVAQQIGECLGELGRRQQVLAVTHLASVAAKADHHFVIEKRVHRGSSSTTLRKVVGAERVAEVARMLAGDEISDESSALARRLLETGR